MTLKKFDYPYFISETILKVLPALLIAFCIGTLDSFKDPLKDLGKSLVSGTWIFLIAVLGIVASFINAIENGNRMKSPSEIIFYILFMVMVALSEELIMRGTITRLLAEKYGKEGKGMVISALIGAVTFGASHLINYLGTHNLEATLQQILAASLGGLLLCAIYIKWGNLLGLIILHAIYDFASLFQYGMIEGKSIADKQFRGSTDIKHILIGNSTFVIAAVIVMLHRKKGRDTESTNEFPVEVIERR